MNDRLIKARSCDGIWLTGTIDGDFFGVKVCDKASGFGIDNGRIIKLYVNSKRNGREIICYERGWWKYPKTPLEEDILDALLTFAASLPKQDVWRQMMRQERVFLVENDEVLGWDDDNGFAKMEGKEYDDSL